MLPSESVPMQLKFWNAPVPFFACCGDIAIDTRIGVAVTVVDPRWVPGDEEPGDGVHAVVELRDLSVLAVPDRRHVGDVVAGHRKIAERIGAIDATWSEVRLTLCWRGTDSNLRFRDALAPPTARP